MLSTIVALVITFALESALLLLALWIMIKIQQLNYKFLGLLGAAVLATAVDMALEHFIGVYFSAPIVVTVLAVCIAKLTKAEQVDVAFTVMVGYAVQFCLNLFVLGALLGDLRPSEQIADEMPADEVVEVVASETNSNHEPEVPPATNANKNVSRSSINEAAPAPTAVVHSTNSPATSTNPPSPPKTPQEVVQNFLFKGIVNQTNAPLALISTGRANYTIRPGETVAMATGSGKISVRCEEADKNHVVLMVGDELVVLHFGTPKR